ncbi:MAG: hypothetical protein JSS94_09760 [Bacteroidetes bacterium]|nr:hypothetical protein [Bacteroidota bacterium]
MQSTGKYKYGTKIGKWKSTLNEKIYQIDRIKNDITKTKFYYYANGKVKQMGQSRLEVTANESHWYYFGDWKYFNEKGKLLYLKKYADGKKIDSISYIQK